MQERVVEREEVDKRRAFYRSLRKSGLVKRIKLRPATGLPPRKLIDAQGPPVLQTIIEERR
jgi:hypothetical protein